MIFVFCALYSEARAVIEHYSMKKCSGNGHFSSYVSGDGTILLTVTGVGTVACATAVSHVLTRYCAAEQNANVHVCNVGTAAGATIGQTYRINSISGDTGRTFYPDILYQCSLPEAALFCGNHILTEGKTETAAKERITGGKNLARLYDMESAGFYQAASAYVAPHQISLIKVVSDRGERISADRVTDLLRQNMPLLAEYFTNIQADLEEEKAKNRGYAAAAEEEQDLLQKLSADIHCSAVMKNELEQYARYCALRTEGLDLKTVIQTLYEEGLAPCADKNAGKRCLKRCKELIL